MSFFESVWHKSLLGKNTVWAKIEYDASMKPFISNYNEAFIKLLDDKYQTPDKRLTQAELFVNFLSGIQAVDLVKEQKIEEPKATFKYHNGKMIVDTYNQAFVNDLKIRLGSITDDLTDDEVVRLYVDKEQIEREEPKLEVVHSGITSDGKVKMKLDWNQAFIRHLSDNGITGESDDEAVQLYLTLLTNDYANRHGEGVLSDDDEGDIDEDQLNREMSNAAKSLGLSEQDIPVKPIRKQRKIKK